MLRPVLEEASRRMLAPHDVLTVRDVLADVEVALLAGEANLDMPVRWVHISELPTRRRSCRVASCCSPPALRSTPQAPARLHRDAGRARAGGAGLRHRLLAREGAQGAGRGGARARLPAVRGALRAAVHRPDREGLHPPGQRAVRAAAAFDRRQERLQRIVLSERGLDAIVGALATLIGGPALVFDGRGGLRPCAPRRELDPEVVTALGQELRERARRGDGRGFVPSHPDSPRAPWPCRSPAASRRARPPAPARCPRPGWWRPRTPTGWPRSTG